MRGEERGAQTSYNKQSKLGSLGLKPNCRSDGSVGVFASLAAVMSPMRQLLAFVTRWLTIRAQIKYQERLKLFYLHDFDCPPKWQFL